MKTGGPASGRLSRPPSMTTNLQPAGLANAALGRPPPARPQAHGQAVNMRIDKGYEDRLAWARQGRANLMRRVAKTTS